MNAQPAIDFYSQHYQQTTATRNEPKWLKQLRTQAMHQLKRDGLPTLRHENWKYTSLRSLLRQQFMPADSSGALDIQIPPLTESQLPVISFVNGQLHQRNDGELSVSTFDEALDNSDPMLERLLGTLVDFDLHPMAAINTALFTNGLLIQTEAGHSHSQPLLIEHISVPTKQPTFFCPRTLIVAKPGSSLTIIERFVGMPDAENYVNAVTELHLGAGARVEHYRIGELAQNEYSTVLTVAEQKQDSELIANSVDLGGKMTRNDLHTVLSKPGAAVRMSGLYMAIGKQHIDNHTRIDHNAPHTTSEEDYHGILADRARAVFNGKVVVASDAQKVTAAQSNRNLLLSGTAEIDTKPELEIYADDVRCSHGATVGQLDAEALFYLRCRGIGERTARALLTFAFAEQVMDQFSLPQLRHYIEQLVAQRLPDHERLEQFL